MPKKKQNKNSETSLVGKTVSITWRDHWDGETWVKTLALEDECLVDSIGVVIRDTDEFITISSHYGRKDDVYGSPTTIWKALIVEGPREISHAT